MFVFGNFLEGVATILGFALDLYMWIIIIRAIISWVNPDPYNPIVQILYRITEPVMAPLRRYLPVSGMGIDFSPLVVIFAIYFLKSFLVRSLYDIASHLR